MRWIIHYTTGSLLLCSLLFACSGGGSGSNSPSSATSLVYTNPSVGDYQLVRDPSSTSTHLVLNLVGPGSSNLSGVGFYIAVDSTKATWSTVGSDWVTTSIFTNPVVKAQVNGGTLQAGIYQLGTASPATSTSTTALATVAIDLKSGGNLPPGTIISLTVPSGKALILDAPGSSSATTAITIAVGTLVAN